jgi:Leucine-rich repeat (LRR) protein
LIESPPAHVLESCSPSILFAWLSKWELANQTKILNFSASNLLEVPMEFAKLDTRTLTEINFSSNQIAIIPDTIDRFHSLTALLLSNNKLQYISKSIFSLSKLQILDVQDNFIKGNASNPFWG